MDTIEVLNVGEKLVKITKDQINLIIKEEKEKYFRTEAHRDIGGRPEQTTVHFRVEEWRWKFRDLVLEMKGTPQSRASEFLPDYSETASTLLEEFSALSQELFSTTTINK